MPVAVSAEAIAAVIAWIDLDFDSSLVEWRISRRRDGRFELKLKHGEQKLALQLSRTSLERLWLLLSFGLASLQKPGQPPLPGSQN